jgi:hypothetical protein
MAGDIGSRGTIFLPEGGGRNAEDLPDGAACVLAGCNEPWDVLFGVGIPGQGLERVDKFG